MDAAQAIGVMSEAGMLPTSARSFRTGNKPNLCGYDLLAGLCRHSQHATRLPICRAGSALGFIVA
jgi:hypothetical protein